MEEKIIEKGVPFLSVKQVSGQQLADLNALAARCRKADKNIINYYPHILEQHRPFASSLLYYQGQQLEGFASMFFFYESACELSLMVGPEFRRQGLARQMIRALMPLLQSQHIQSIIVTSPAKQFSSLFEAYGFQYNHSEFQMERHGSHPVLLPQSKNLFRFAKMADEEDILHINALCFPEQDDQLQHRLTGLLNDRHYDIMLLQRGENILGKAHIRYHDNTAIFSDIGILPNFQGHGLGTELLAHCINHCLQEGYSLLCLDVETENTSALKLYTRLGFEVINACDYWQVDIRDLPQGTA